MMKKFDSINVIPFIDIMLVLLAIVLATASFISQGKIEVNVPQSQSNTENLSDAQSTLITLNKEGLYFYQGKAVTLAELETVLNQLDKNREIRLKIDAESSFQQFSQLAELLKMAQLDHVSVITIKATEP